MQAVCFNGKMISPSKVVCIGRNYVAHIKELNNEHPTAPVIFVKPNSAISDQIIAHGVDAIHYEAELSFVIQHNKIVGVGIGLDLTKREVQTVLKAKGLPWERAKGFDQSAVFTAFIRIHEIDSLRLVLSKNHHVVQQASIDLMIYKPKDIIENVSEFMTFENDDILMTGTPEGVGEIHQGDCFVAKLFDEKELLLTHQWVVR